MKINFPKTTKEIYTSNLGYSLDFEYAMTLLLGSKADHIASFASNEKYLRKWLRKAIKKFIKDVNLLDTTERHKEMLVMKLECVDKLLKKGGSLWSMIFDFFNLVSRFLGYDYDRAQKLVTPTYFQTQSQNFWCGLYKDESSKKQKENKDNFISKRIKTLLQLKSEDYSDFEISQILNTSEYNIKKILRECST